MKTAAQWAEQLPELIRIEFLIEAKKEKALRNDFKSIVNVVSSSIFWDKTLIGFDFWQGVDENIKLEPTSADYIDESVPYTKEKVEAMILEYADPNDEVCKVMLANVNNYIGLRNKHIKHYPKSISTKAALKILEEKELISKENEALKSTVDGLTKENAELISETQRLNAIVENQKMEIDWRKDEMHELKKETIALENNNHELLELIKPTPQPKPSLLQRFINWLS